MSDNDLLLQNIDRKLGECCGKIDYLCEELSRHRYEIHGNGTPGLKIRMDRVEQTAERAAKGRTSFWSAVVAMGSVVVQGVMQLFSK